MQRNPSWHKSFPTTLRLRKIQQDFRKVHVPDDRCAVTRKTSLLLLTLLVASCGDRGSPVTTDSLLQHPESHLGDRVCLPAVLDVAHVGMIIRDDTESRYGVPLLMSVRSHEAYRTDPFVRWVSRVGNGRAIVLVEGRLVRSDEHPGYPYGFEVIEVLEFTPLTIDQRVTRSQIPFSCN